jgi:hypothetical protein
MCYFFLLKTLNVIEAAIYKIHHKFLIETDR